MILLYKREFLKVTKCRHNFQYRYILNLCLPRNIIYELKLPPSFENQALIYRAKKLSPKHITPAVFAVTFYVECYQELKTFHL